MIKMTKSFITILCFAGLAATAQERLTLQQSIQKTLQHNFDINMSDLSAKQAERNNTLGNAGFSPTVMINASATESRSNSHIDLANNSVQDNPNGKNVNYNPTVTVAWTLFDGGKMFLVKKQLNELETIGQEQLKLQVQTMVSRCIQMYAQVLLQQKQLVAIDTALALAKTRMVISGAKFQNGAGPKVDFLQARVDYNARQSDSLSQEASYTQALDSLCVLMGENEDNKYVLDDSLELNTTLVPVDKNKLVDMNYTIDIYKRNAAVSGLNARIAKTYFLPDLFFNGGYSYTQTTSATGFSTFSRSYGPNGTFTLVMPLFEGGNLRRQSKVASLQAMRDELLYEKQNTVIGRAYRTAWKNYNVAVSAYKLESENIKYAKENLDVQLARFRVGVGTTLEVRQAENDYVTALETLYTSEYNLKVSETVVLELESQLVK